MQFQKSPLALALSASLFIHAGFSGTAEATQGYEVTALDTVPGAISATVTGFNNNGHYTGVAYNLADILIRTELLDPEDFKGVDDLNNLSAADYTFVRNKLQDLTGLLPSSEAQKISSLRGFIFNGQYTLLTEALDEIEPTTGLLSQSNDVFLNDMNELGAVVGESRAPFLQEDGFNDNGEATIYFVNNRYPLALWSDGVQHSELPAEPGLTYGGLSRAHALNDNNMVVGFAAVADEKRIVDSYENCINPESVAAHLPTGACMYTPWLSSRFGEFAMSPLYKEEAYLWELNANGQVLSQQSLGVAPTLLDEQENVDEEEKIEGVVRSEALDINNQGIAVGFTSARTSVFLINYATVFKDGEAVWALPENTEGLTQSRATQINDNGYIVGYASKSSFRYPRKRLFVSHIDGREPFFPSGFFSHSAWVANDINNQNQIVGHAERDRTHVQNRATSAFMYDIDADKLVDLNSTLSCNSGYYLFEAVSINDSGDIIALANQEVTREINGRTFTTNAVQPVLLRPSDSVEACGDNLSSQERKGAAISPIQIGIAATLAVFGIFGRRRLKVKK